LDGFAFPAGFDGGFVALVGTATKRPYWSTMMPDDPPLLAVRSFNRLGCCLALCESGSLAFFQRRDGEVIHVEQVREGDPVCIEAAPSLDNHDDSGVANGDQNENQGQHSTTSGEEGSSEDTSATVLLGFADGPPAMYDVSTRAPLELRRARGRTEGTAKRTDCLLTHKLKA
jgi:hypothetical protein